MSLLLVGLSFSVSAIECKTYKTRHILKKAIVTKDEKICISKYGGVAASSEKCSELDNKGCPFNNLKKTLEYENFVSELGSPGFNLCHHLAGSPQIYDVKINDKWTRFERCYGKKSVEFVDINRLIQRYRAL